MTPSSCGKRKSPASLRVDSRRSTNRREPATAPVSSSRVKRTLEPTALMWAPGESHAPFRIGFGAAVTVQMMLAPVTASSADGVTSTVTPCSAAAHSPYAWACAGVRLQTRMRPRRRTASIASRWDRAWTPDPRIARSLASSRAKRRVATADVAAVRIAVIARASTMASGRPSSLSNRVTVP